MAKPHTTYKKRQKELARMEKQREKAARRMERKTGPKPAESDEEASLDGAAPLDGPAHQDETAPAQAAE
jgi:hypothetical protein